MIKYRVVTDYTYGYKIEVKRGMGSWVTAHFSDLGFTPFWLPFADQYDVACAWRLPTAQRWIKKAIKLQLLDMEEEEKQRAFVSEVVYGPVP